MHPQKPVNTWTFLKDVLICSLGAYGGPEAHYGVFSTHMVEKKAYLTSEELTQYIALTSLLPGPSSTQTLVAIGYQQGGRKLALLTLLVWALPVVLFMTLMSFSQTLLGQFDLRLDGLRYLAPLAVAFVFVALVNLAKKAFKTSFSLILAVVAFIVSTFLRMVWVFPLLMIVGGALMVMIQKASFQIPYRSLKPPWMILVTLVVIAISSFVLARHFDVLLLTLFDAFFRYGYLVIGGGQVLVPYMYTGLVETFGYLSSEAFMTGYGLVQGLPGPMFSFSAYAGGLAAVNEPTYMQVLAALISVTGIFLPAVLLIFFVIPIWDQIKENQGMRVALQGVIAVAIGVIAATGFSMFQAVPFTWDRMLVLVAVIVLMLSKKVSAPWVVLSVILFGFILPS